MRKVKTSWDSQQRNRKLGAASLGSRRAIADLFVLFISKLPIVLIWNIQSLQGNRPVTPLKCTKSAYRGTGMIYDSCRFDIGRFRVEPTDLRKESTSEWHICISQCPVFLTLRVLHKLKTTWIEINKSQPTDMTFCPPWRNDVFLERSVRVCDGSGKCKC